MKYFLLFILSASIYGQVRFIQLNNWPTSNDIYAAQIFDTAAVWGFGEAGMMIYSEDAGKSWHGYYEHGVQEDIFDSYFFEDNTGFITGEKGALYFTEDSCKSWEKISTPVRDSLYSIEFYDHSGAIAGGNGTILISSDKGNTWEKSKYDGKDNFRGIAFLSQHELKAVAADGVIAVSRDGGKSWQKRILDETIDFKDVYFINSQHGIICGTEGAIVLTQNGGRSWQTIHTAKRRSGESGIMIWTNDAGENWQIRYTGNVFDMYALDLYSEDFGISFGARGAIAKIRDSGYRFFTVVDYTGSTQKNLFSIVAVTENVIIATGWNGAILRTGNKGKDWNKPSPKTPMQFNDIVFTNDHTGWTVAEGGAVRTSVDTGRHWSSVDVGTREWLESVYFMDENNGWVVGSKGTIRGTYNEGREWFLIDSLTYADLRSVWFDGKYDGFIVGDSGVFIHSRNGGHFWDTEYLPVNKQLNEIHVSNKSYIVGDDGLLFTSFDQGKTWIRNLTEHENDFNSVTTAGPYTWVAGDSGLILFSDNGFRSWTKLFSTTKNTLNKVRLYADTIAYLAGKRGIVLKSINLRQNEIDVPKASGGYFAFNVAKSDTVRIDLFNKEGKYLRTLIKEYLREGKSLFYLSAQAYDLEKGVYWTRLRSASQQDIRKIIIY